MREGKYWGSGQYHPCREEDAAAKHISSLLIHLLPSQPNSLLYPAPMTRSIHTTTELFLIELITSVPFYSFIGPCIFLFHFSQLNQLQPRSFLSYATHLQKKKKERFKIHITKLTILLFYFICLWVITAHGSSQARGQIGTVDASLYRSHSNVGSKLHL